MSGLGGGRMDWLDALHDAFSAGLPVTLATVVRADGREDLIGRHLVVAPGRILASQLTSGGVGGVPADAAAREIESALATAATEALESGRTSLVKVAGLSLYLETHLPPPSLVVVGAGHVAQPLVHIGQMLGFRVMVVDDRPGYATGVRFPEASQVIHEPLIPALRSLDLGRRDYVVLVTRGHRHDMDCLRELVERPLAYIGMIGSRTRVETVFRLLAEEGGVDPAYFARVHAPIGLDIGARTPAEIAVAVAAELLKVRSGGTGESLFRLGRARIHAGNVRTGNGSPPDQSLWSTIREVYAANTPAALATVVQTRGHTPREVGAKMLVLRGGEIAGTIGGGCGESAVRLEALSVIDQGRPSMVTIDLLDDPSLADGAVCGGKMEVFVEPLVALTHTGSRREWGGSRQPNS